MIGTERQRKEGGDGPPQGSAPQKEWTVACRRAHAWMRSNGEAMKSMQKTNDEIHWVRTTNLMLVHLGIWLFFGFIIHMFVNVLNKVTIPILDFPLGFYMAAQGSLIVFVVMLFMFARQQNKIDREHGYAEDE